MAIMQVPISCFRFVSCLERATGRGSPDVEHAAMKVCREVAGLAARIHAITR